MMSLFTCPQPEGGSTTTLRCCCNLGKVLRPPKNPKRN